MTKEAIYISRENRKRRKGGRKIYNKRAPPL
jgi:hypothetical protein